MNKIDKDIKFLPSGIKRPYINDNISEFYRIINFSTVMNDYHDYFMDALDFDEEITINMFVDSCIHWSDDEEIFKIKDNRLFIEKVFEKYEDKYDEYLREMIFDHNEFYCPALLDRRIAKNAGLLPFYYNTSMFLLAAPYFTQIERICRLDYYQAMSGRSIDNNSLFIMDKKQFKLILGKEKVYEMEKMLRIK